MSLLYLITIYWPVHFSPVCPLFCSIPHFSLHYFSVAEISYLLPDRFVKYDNNYIQLNSANFGSFIRNIAEINQIQVDGREFQLVFYSIREILKNIWLLFEPRTASLKRAYENG